MAQLRSLTREIDGTTYRSVELPALTKIRAGALAAPLLRPFLKQLAPFFTKLGSADAKVKAEVQAMDTKAMLAEAVDGVLSSLKPEESQQLICALVQSTWAGATVMDTPDAVNMALIGQGFPHLVRLLLFVLETNDFFGFPAIGSLTRKAQEAGASPANSTPA